MVSYAIVKFLCDSRPAYTAKIDSIGSAMRVSTFSFVPLLSTKFTTFFVPINDTFAYSGAIFNPRSLIS